MQKETVIRAHSYQHFAELQLSAHEFYLLIERMIADYQYPTVTCTRTNMKERSLLFSDSREYLAIARRDCTYYICAAPFGRSFFISWWLKDADAATYVSGEISWWQWMFTSAGRSKTYFEYDTDLMFSNSIEAIIKSAIQHIMQTHGIRQPDAVE